MRKWLFLATAVAMVFASPLAQAQQKKALEVYFIDVEGGQSTLFVSPSGQSLLVDTGWPGDRDAGRIAAVAKMAGVSQIDYLGSDALSRRPCRRRRHPRGTHSH